MQLNVAAWRQLTESVFHRVQYALAAKPGQHGQQSIKAEVHAVLTDEVKNQAILLARREDDRGRWHPVGCEHCMNTGYKGRTGVYEMMVVDDKVRSLIHSRAAESQLFVAAEAAGLRSMREDGQRLIDAGITSAEEVLRVTRD